ncbi:MAG: exodeoxyribonuclease V subunit beta [Methylococcaceae bacterium]|nr:exodeoxyribonuclease V subunit beta [Methylococcaceae bacterium]
MTAAISLNPVNFPLNGTRLIEASAGTGKTYTIAALYVRLILGHDVDKTWQGRELLPPDILVVTFTEASTKELRERVRDRLSQAARFFRQQTDKSDAFLEAIRADYEVGLWPACARRLELAANWMDEAAVFTIHGWCNRMLQQHAFDSGSLFHQEINTDDTELLNEVVRDYWRSFYYQISHDDPNFQVLYGIFKQPDDLQNNIGLLLKNSDPITNPLANSDSISSLINAVTSERQQILIALKQPWQRWSTEIKLLLETAVKNKVLQAKNYKSNNIQNWIDKIIAWSGDPSQETLDIGKGFDNLSPVGMARMTNPGQTPPSHPGFEALSQLVRQLEVLPSLKVELIKHAVHWIRHRYDYEKQRMARMTFDDMLTRLDKALHGNNGQQLAKVIQQQYPIALIDEFQDTDPVQYRIFSSLYPAAAANEAGCLMIGDPKQAIYSFRGADIYTYLKAHQDTLGRHYTLGTNYRSAQALVEAVNQVFVHADQQPQGAFRFKRGADNPLPFIPVTAQGRDAEWVINDVIAPALSIWHWQATEAVGMPEYRESMAELTASEIVRLLNGVPSGKTGFKSSTGMEVLQPADIAILVRSSTEAKIMRNALARREVRSVYLSERDSIFATREANDLLFWLKALADPRNERKVRTALSTATFGWSYQALQQLALNEPVWEQHLERFLGYQIRWQQDGILPALRQLMNDYALHAHIKEAIEGERCLTNLLHLAELLQQASSQIEGEQALIRYLAESIKAGRRHSGDESIIRLESDANLIKVITIHKSKGLEYPLVFLPFICSFREVVSGSSDYYRYHDEHRQLTVDLTKNKSIRTLSDEERLQEDLRLLYVAMTRARYACWLGVAPVKAGNSKVCQLEKSAFGAVVGWQTGMPANALGQQLEQLKGSCNSIQLMELPSPTHDRYRPPLQTDLPDAARIASVKISSDWWVASYSALQIEDKAMPRVDLPQLPQEPETARDDKHKDETELSREPPNQTAQGIHGLPRGSEPGVLIHDLLEQCGHLGFSSVLANPELAKDLIQQRFNAREWLDKYDIIFSALSHWLTMPLLEGIDICLADLDIDAHQAELEFLIGADSVDVQILDQLVNWYTFAGQARPGLIPKQVNGLLKGFIDLVFVHNQKYYVVDYKFNSLGSNNEAYTSEALESAMLAKRYDIQYTLYLLALHRLLSVRLGAHYDYDQHIGGALYLFLRGSQAVTGGRVFDKPPRILIESLDRLFIGSTGPGKPL